MNGVCGKVLLVDVTKKSFMIKYLDDSFYKTYLSGVGLAAVILNELIPIGADPLGPDNVLGFTSGFLTGSGAFFSGRWLAVTKSPLTGTWGEANGGGNFSPAIKRCGFDGIFFQGASENPVLITIDENSVTFDDATLIWGKDVEETEEWLYSKYGRRKPSTVVIGEAGENLSLISGIVNDSARIAARAGVGAVMGSKKIKAIALNGKMRMPSKANGKKVIALNKIASRYVLNVGSFLPAFGVTLTGILFRTEFGRMLTDKFMSGLGGIIVPAIYKKWGTTGLNKMSMHWGDAPVKNWQGTVKDFKGNKLEKIAPNKILAKQRKAYHCYNCPLGCGGTCDLTGYQPKKMHKPEYESLMSLGPLLMIDNLEFLMEINHRLNLAGMDTISAGGTIAFAMECFEKGLIDKTVTGGMNLEWGNQEAVAELVEQMIKREGFGAVLSDGSKVAAMKINELAKEFAIHAGGQEMSMHDPRLDPGYGLHASVDPNPGKHTTGSYLFYQLFRLHTRLEDVKDVPLISSSNSALEASDENAKKAVLTSKYTQLVNACGLCMFGSFLGADRLRVFDYINAVAGWEKTPEDYMEIGHRIQTLRQMFNIREGVNPWDNRMNLRLAGQPAQNEGPNKERAFDINTLMQKYWQEMGWDAETGVPLDETIEALGLQDFM